MLELDDRMILPELTHTEEHEEADIFFEDDDDRGPDVGNWDLHWDFLWLWFGGAFRMCFEIAALAAGLEYR